MLIRCKTHIWVGHPGDHTQILHDRIDYFYTLQYSER